ncbi:MAG: DNA-3-methyladenine glycosylase 2 family protein [Rhodothermaceae bacterium]|nr:DNA-3-methyladenine glycosylase 2 family protein [Rhodothermaceae bacterium]MXX59256.1 DNA-3-methyladenine glycosylase 2 family protein [Rhodothermaceae bacterium]MYD19294.1 DNA-3-methyladenine glycosylase 2 family protein [Rhodothermaceae bacterium]MYD55653.1 DNA-3-methyladenine glycosylase 2 family protein [Rhodothermaceae bacterium]MYI44721.1 DNA-3-methyladenine glycosylase 2 family protein [Rhodothermaceae bacterium]
MLSLDIDEAVSALRASDTHMANLIARVGPFELALTDEWSPFQALVRSVIFQQISTHAGRAIQGRLFSLFDGSAPEPDAVLQTTPEELRGVGLSQAKEKTIRNLAVHAADGTLPDQVAMEKLTDEEIIKTLTIHRGIGIWTAQMLLIFNLGRPDVWPVTDLGIRRGYKIAYGLDELPMPSELRDIGDRWKPFRSIASWYLWRANDL